MIVWDWGTWKADPSTPDAGVAIRAGELKFSLDGQKLRGAFVIVRTQWTEGAKDQWASSSTGAMMTRSAAGTPRIPRRASRPGDERRGSGTRPAQTACPDAGGGDMNELAYRAAERRLWRSIGAQPTERRIHLERIGVDVRIQEIGAGPPVLFIHGVATSGVSWAGLAARAKGFRCLVLDRPGTGLSEPLGRPLDPGTLAAMADVLVADVLDALEVPSAHIVASSFGGYMALRSAAATPERVARMVQFSWPVGAPTPTLPLFLRAMSVPGFRRLVEAFPRTERSMRMLFHQLGHRDKLLDGGSAARTSPATSP